MRGHYELVYQFKNWSKAVADCCDGCAHNGGDGCFFIVKMSTVYHAANYGNVNSVPSLQALFQILSGEKNYYIGILRHIQSKDEASMAIAGTTTQRRQRID